ncbi:type VI secretion system membrane subunit TssM [Psychromonas sp. psych-6C06]|uniref:type VI secretion system membrane subunit TssM n=1 Tax=Psychromonas sp. psych-6C06 TaxID=2058089 RepID=UPI000C32D060|nr:type VI secretion system membrane subunit TssM [Psychromonas sp. psych-6C06]PKF63494.1 type VI secretion system membrane subunit TssM [Psychromonas sp. psych-6C06]
MKHIIAFFKNRIVISLIGLIILSLLVWFIGPGIKFGDQNTAFLASESTRLIVILIMSLLWGINNLRIQLQEKNNNSKLVNDLQQVDDNAGDIISDQTSEEMLQMNERFSQALTTLKGLNFSGKNSKAALYELPWYIIIGPPGSGKTTALVNSSLDFPLADQFGKGALQGVGGTRNCDWWFTNNAVLIDTAGRYTTQDSHKVIDSSAWEGFLTLLKKHRRRRPINGAIVAISLQELLTQTEEERVKHAKTIRLRIDELMEKLEVRFPVYLMFTKCDLVSGFTEFFEDLGKEEREQILGISLPDAPEASQAPDFATISSEYKNIVKRLYERVLSRLHNERDVKRRSAIQGFPQQMESLQDTIDSFLQQTFVQNRFKLQPYLRGVYFTSGTQDGTPIDRLMASVSANFGFNSVNSNSPLQQGKSYFLGKMFKDVIFPEAELVGTNPFYERLLKWTQRFAYTALVGVSVTLIAFWTGAFSQHENNTQAVQNYLAEYQGYIETQSRYNNDIRATLPALNALAKASIVFDQEQQPWVKSLGMYDDSVNDAADEAYLNHLKLVFYPQLIKYIETHLNSNTIDENLYNAFRTYVMFNKLEHMDKALVQEWFIEKWEVAFAQNSDDKQALLAHLAVFLNTDLQPAVLNNQVLTSTRQRLLRMPIEQRIYQRIKSRPEFSQKVNMLNEMGGAVRDTYLVNPAMQQALIIPVLYTKGSYDQIDFSEDSELIVSIAKEKWLLHDESKNEVNFVSDDLKSISKKVKKLYLTDYNKQWQNIYNAMNVKTVSNLMQANNVMTSFADPIYSPIVAILNVTSFNTELSSQMAANIADDNTKGAKGEIAKFAASKVQWTSVDKKYRDINVLLRESKKQPPPINTALMKISQVQEMLNSISLAPDPNKKAFDLARARYQSGANNAITSLNSYAKNTPEPVKRWLRTLADEAWRIVLRSAHQHVNTEWRNTVYQPYLDSIAGRYPIVANASSDIALFDFVEFFKPGGNIDSFYQGYIKPFITTRGGWRNKSVDKHSLGLSSRTLAQVKRALEIKSVFFRKNPEVPSLAFNLKPNSMPKNNVRFMLEVGDNRLRYSHGPKFWKNLTWMADGEQNRVRIVFEDLDEQEHSKTFHGPWAWFKLLKESKVTKTSAKSTYIVTFAIANGSDDSHKVSYRIQAKSVKNPFEKKLLSKFRCPEGI